MAKFDDIIRFLNEAYSDVPVQTPPVAPKAPVAGVEDEDEDLDHEGLETPEAEATEEVTGQEDEVPEPTEADISAISEPKSEELADDELSADVESDEDFDDESVFGDDDEVPSDDATDDVRSELGMTPDVADEEDQIGRSSLENDIEDREEHNARVREKFKAWRNAQRDPKDYGM